MPSKPPRLPPHAHERRRWSPGIPLVAALVALTIQLVAYYATHVLPDVLVGGRRMDRFDELVDGLPVLGGDGGTLLGTLIALAALAHLSLGYRRGVHAPVPQGIAGLLALLAVGGPTALPALFG